MQKEDFMAADEFCAFYHVERSFLSSLQEYGLIEMETFEEKKVIYTEKLPQLEQFIHLHYDLEINLEGIDAIGHLLERVKGLHAQINELRNQLKRYE
jgi:chaperone modulatory protein CbpM